MRDTLYILDRQFEDPGLPGRSFYCRDCITIDGLLTSFPEAAAGLDVVRIGYPRPRHAVIEAIGEANQNLPVLVLSDDAPAELADGQYQGALFVADFKKLLRVLSTRHGFPEAHP